MLRLVWEFLWVDRVFAVSVVLTALFLLMALGMYGRQVATQQPQTQPQQAQQQKQDTSPVKKFLKPLKPLF